MNQPMPAQPQPTPQGGNQKPGLPEGTWAVTKEDKEEIVKFGRELNNFFLQYAKDNAKDGKFHIKIFAGAGEYVMGIHNQKAKLIAEDVLMCQDTMEKFGLGNVIIEPFVPTQEELEAEAKAKAEAEAEAAAKQEAIDNAVADPQVAEAPAEAAPEVSTPNTEATDKVAEVNVEDPLRESAEAKAEDGELDAPQA